MPTYSYRCNDCGHQFDQRQRMSDDPLTVCPECQGTIRRVVNSVGVVFKGSGFYVTDNRSKNSAKYASSNGKNADTSSETDQSAEKKSTPAAETKQTSSASASASA
jgi:putative FmdB family regulatory protein